MRVGTRAVGRDVQERRQVLELLPPVLYSSIERSAMQRVVLPLGVMPVLKPRRRIVASAAGSQLRVCPIQVSRQHSEGPEVSEKPMNIRDQDVIVVAASQKRRPYERTALEIESILQLASDMSPDSCFSGVRG